jgi:DNA-binding NarL/FixJ family response regulator
MGVRLRRLDFTPLMERLRERPGLIAAALQDAHTTASLVVCTGNRALLGAWLNIPLRSRDGREIPIAGAATTALEALGLVERHQPSLLLCTDQLEEGDGATVVETVKQRHPSTHTILVVRDGRRRQTIRRAMDAGCDGICLETRVGQGTILAAVQSICAGGTYLERQLADQRQQGAVATEAQGMADLSTRQVEVLRGVQHGLTNEEIARQLYLSPETVKTHLRQLRQKLGARDRGHAAVLAMRQGLIE